MKYLMIASLLIISTGCSTMGRINKVSLGMTKSEVIEQMGDPDSTKAINNEETLVYMLSEVATPVVNKPHVPYWVILVNGKVKQYGRAGDYGSAEPTHIVLDQNISTK